MDCVALSAEELIRRCLETGDAAAWAEFVRRFHRLVATVAMRVARRWGEPSPQLIDDLVQETYLKLCQDDCRVLRTFQPQHPDAFYGYLKVVTANLVHDRFKAERADKRGSGMAEVADEPMAGAAAPPSALQSGEQQILFRELDGVLCRLTEGPHQGRDRRIFWLYYRVGLTANAIAALPSIGLATKGVESIILRLTRLLRQEMADDRLREGADAG